MGITQALVTDVPELVLDPVGFIQNVERGSSTSICRISVMQKLLAPEKPSLTATRDEGGLRHLRDGFIFSRTSPRNSKASTS